MALSDPRQEPRRPLIETLTITNTGTTPCQIGSPREAGANYSPPVLRVDALATDKTTYLFDASGGGGNTLLAPGKSVTTTISTDTVDGLDVEQCSPKQLGAFRIYPPANADEAIIAAAPRTVCTIKSNNPQRMQVSSLPSPPG